MYANDCIAITDRDRRRKLKKITHHSDRDLDVAIEIASRKFGIDFWVLLHGIDSYMEKRRRRPSAEYKFTLIDEPDDEHMWGNS